MKQEQEPMTAALEEEMEMKELQAAALDGLEQTVGGIGEVNEDFLASIKAQEEILRQDVPEVKLSQEMEEFPLFAAMLAWGENLLDVYCYFHPDFAEKKMEETVMGRIQKRNLRPRSIKNSPQQTRVNVEQLSEEDMAQIDKRVRRGEKISF